MTGLKGQEVLLRNHGHVSFCKQRKMGSRKAKEETVGEEMEEEEDCGVEGW